MGHLIIINAPTSFTYIWAVAKHWLAQETIDKIDIVGHDYKEVLLSIIDEKDLPAKYGGKCTCEVAGEEGGLGGGCVMSAAGPWMVERMKRKEEKEKRESESEVDMERLKLVVEKVKASSELEEGKMETEVQANGNGMLVH
jgi:hypothetical protein